MIRQAYKKPEVRALMIQQSGLLCTSLTDVNGEGLDYGGPGGSIEPQSHNNFSFWEEEEDDIMNSDP